MASKPRLDGFVDMTSPQAVWAETACLLGAMSGSTEMARLGRAFEDVRALFDGRYPGYRACNTDYHDLQHTTDTLLAMVRLAHGAWVEGRRFSGRELSIAVVSALFHDAGYIQTEADTEGTGAKYTATHVDRSIGFLRGYVREKGLSADFARSGADIVLCTGLHVDIPAIRFESSNIELLGKMLGAGDLLGQMADRCYLEKLLFLFYEFQEGSIPGFKEESDLLRKTLDFYDVTRQRFAGELSGVDGFMRAHFRQRWSVDRDVYADTIARHMHFLKTMLERHPGGFRALLKRGGLVDKLKRASPPAL